MDPTTDLAAARVTDFLEREPVLWLSTVGTDGAPCLVPTWFAWDGEAILVLSKPGARKVRNVSANPRVMIAVGDAEADFDVAMLEARAELLPTSGHAALPTAFAAKYAERILELGLTHAQFAATYSQAIRIVPTRALGWHGRSTPDSVTQAAALVASHGRASILEPWRAALRGLFGEPMGRRLASA